MRPPAIIDTNVVIAGLLTSRPDSPGASPGASPVAQILDGMLAAKFPYVLSEALLAEYRVVLERPKLHKLHGLGAAEQESILIALAQHAIVLKPVATSPASDAGDQHLWELLAVRDDLLLVTGDKRLLDDRRMRDRIHAPADFVRMLHW